MLPFALLSEALVMLASWLRQLDYTPFSHSADSELWLLLLGRPLSSAGWSPGRYAAPRSPLFHSTDSIACCVAPRRASGGSLVQRQCRSNPLRRYVASTLQWDT
jgi:hypothetical protein